MHRPVLVTGASSGIGEAIAVHLAQKGFTVFAGARRVDKLMALSGLGGGRIRPVALDVTDPESISAAMDVVSQRRRAAFRPRQQCGRLSRRPG